MDKDNLHLYDRFKSFWELLQRLNTNSWSHSNSNSNNPPNELYFNCFFAIKIIVLSGFSPHFILPYIFSQCLYMFVCMYVYACLNVCYILSVYLYLHVYIHILWISAQKKKTADVYRQQQQQQKKHKVSWYDLCLVCGVIGYIICQRNGKYGPLGWHFSLSHLFVPFLWLRIYIYKDMIKVTLPLLSFGLSISISISLSLSLVKLNNATCIMHLKIYAYTHMYTRRHRLRQWQN